MPVVAVTKSELKEVLCLSNRTLVKVIAYENCISIKTISRKRKSPQRFFINLDDLAQLETKTGIIVKDINSFATLHRDVSVDTLEIRFTWLNGTGSSVSGYEETVVLPYSRLIAFVRDSSVTGRAEEWTVLSLKETQGKPKFVFKSGETLHTVVSSGVLRRKLVRALRDNFNWPGSEQIHFHADFLPYSFIFEEIRGGQPALVGGLILHGQENMKKAYYSVHT